MHYCSLRTVPTSFMPKPCFLLQCKKKVFHPPHLILETANKCSTSAGSFIDVDPPPLRMLYSLATDNLRRDGTWWVALLWGQGEDTGLAHRDKEGLEHWWPRSPAKCALPLGEGIAAALSHRGTPCSLTATATVDAHLKLSHQGLADACGQTMLPFLF